MRATLRSPTVNTSVDYSMRRAEAEVREALLEALQPATRSGAGADIELSASVAPVLRPDAKTAAKPEPEVEGPSCVQLEGSWPSDDDKHVSGQLDYVALTFEEKVTWDVGTALELRGQSAACADVWTSTSARASSRRYPGRCCSSGSPAPSPGAAATGRGCVPPRWRRWTGSGAS
ncbi:unnamed protein product, partial [Prorocentrum cordatum]